MCQPGRPTPHGASHDVSSPFLRRLPEREVARILLRRVRLLLGDLIGPLTGQRAVGLEPSDAEVHVAVRRVRMTARQQLLDQHDDLRHRLRGERKRVGHPETEALGVLEVPGGRLEGSRGTPAGRGLVDLVVDVGDVVHEPYRMALLAQPPRQPREDDERPGVADVGPLVDRRTADVDPDRLGRRRKLDERARQRVLQTHWAIVVGRGSASASPLRPPHALERLARRQRKDDGPELGSRAAPRSTPA